MDQPLWQNWLNIALIGFIARRAAVAVALQTDGLNALVRGTYVAVLVACACAGIAVWLSTRWVVAGLCVLATTFTVASLVELSQVDPAPVLPVVFQLGVALLGTGALVMLARRNAQLSS